MPHILGQTADTPEEAARSADIAAGIERERRAVLNVKLLARVLASAAAPIWHWGDGDGGAVLQMVVDAHRELAGGA